MTPMFANALLGWLERPPPMPAHCLASPPQVAVVLAGGVDAIPRDDNDASVLGVASRRRIERAVEWWRARPGRVIVVSGGPDWRGGRSRKSVDDPARAAPGRARGSDARRGGFNEHVGERPWSSRDGACAAAARGAGQLGHAPAARPVRDGARRLRGLPDRHRLAQVPFGLPAT
jgi:hypothetical protein